MSITVVEIRKTASKDIDEHASALRGWNQRYDQLGAGVFSGKFLQVHLPGVALFRETTNVKLCQDIVAPPRSVTFALPLPGSADGVFDRQTVGVGAALILHGGINQKFFCRDRMDLVAAVLDFDELGDAGQAVADCLPARGAGVLQGAGTGAIAALIAAMIGELSASLPQESDKTEFSALPSAIAFRCLDLLRGHSAEMHPNMKSRQRYRLIAEIPELIDSFGEDLPSLPVLAQKLGVSIRTLEYCFTEAVGLSPSVYIRNVRLNQARRDLRAARSQHTTVAEIATKWGFWHFGRFSSFYRELFGESPSATLRGPTARTAG